MTSPIDEATVRDRQARIAERIFAEPDAGDPDHVRHLLLDGQRRGKVVWTGGRWAIHYRFQDGYVDSGNDLLAEADDLDAADRHGVGWLADAIARGQLDVGGQR